MIPYPHESAEAPRMYYLAGPMSGMGLPDDEVAWGELMKRCELASRVSGLLLDQGIITINPYGSCVSPSNWLKDRRQDWYAADLWMLTLCDGIVLLPGWQESKGVTLHELPFCLNNGLSVYEWDEEREQLGEYKNV